MPKVRDIVDSIQIIDFSSIQITVEEIISISPIKDHDNDNYKTKRVVESAWIDISYIMACAFFKVCN
jgi:hypothetical protein